MRTIKIGFLPLYIKLYDDVNPQYRQPMIRYMKTVIKMLEAEGLEIVEADLCRVKAEFFQAAALFRDADVDAVITQHLAYSPSLESIDALMEIKAPLIVMDTTPTYNLLERQEYENCISPNHGIHGVQDMCNLLRQRGKPYRICAGHAMHSDVVAQVAGLCRAAAAAKAFSMARIGSVGGSFDGMGDFYVAPEALKGSIGAQVVAFTAEDSVKYLAEVQPDAIEREKRYDQDQFVCEIRDEANYEQSIRSGLALRRWMEDMRLTALTVNFLNVDKVGLSKMPFVELSKAMMRGAGYAGEGDVLTAGMVGALLSVYPETTFTEMFCPDWQKDVILLSHMGEMNLALSQWQPHLVDMEFRYNATGNTTVAYGCLKAGKAVLVNLAPMGDGYRMTLAPVEMLPLGREFGAYKHEMQGWMAPPLPLDEFLPRYSQSGGTHHSALVYGAQLSELKAFGEYLGAETEVIG